MDHAGAVGGMEASSNLFGETERSINGEGGLAVDNGLEINSINILHHNIGKITILPHIVDINDVWMAQHRCSLCLVAKACEKIGLTQQALLGNFDGDAPISPAIASNIDAGHAPFADLALKFIATIENTILHSETGLTLVQEVWRA